MNEVSGQLVGKCCIVYLDIIVVYRNNAEDHANHIKMILDVLREANPRVSSHVILPQGASTDPDKTIVIDYRPVQKTKRTYKTISEFNYTIEHRPEKELMNADALSRKRIDINSIIHSDVVSTVSLISSKYVQNHESMEAFPTPNIEAKSIANVISDEIFAHMELQNLITVIKGCKTTLELLLPKTKENSENLSSHCLMLKHNIPRAHNIIVKNLQEHMKSCKALYDKKMYGRPFGIREYVMMYKPCRGNKSKILVFLREELLGYPLRINEGQRIGYRYD
ncbi:hypothetical protein RF11_09424 [Thelohanellus kitauei]|uniref:Reverse transcriptase domain-containing protein n=1 Tax=Thelohanellus kitauei TaxID=669202 RepID=A0A0C2IXC8_THEKT|nr:hypothetical protein RF11_09424 [Thelohanellus kitauei]